ncbi:hypothetical protein CFP56_028005 [Quercus suber]|uniref:DC1 domain-containing protein n=1 Tax=Quercus suber TaxID=58331 RepID=A0AAW0JWE8_QUESU
MELQHWRHLLHPLVFNEDERSGRRCWGCFEPIFGPSYSCKECRGEYVHHKSCAELSLGLHHPSHPNHPLILFGLFTYYDNNEEEYGRFSKCDVCGEKSLEYSYCCYRCNFNIHIRCSSLSLTIQTEVHDPQLTCSIWKLMKFTCNFYDKEGNLPYFCVQSDFAIHSRCAACPRKLKVDCHNHPLHLTPYLEVHQSDSPICLLCVRKVDTLCLYYCSRCDFAAHLYCAMLPQNKEYINLQELKEEQSTKSKSEDPELHQSFDSKICKVIKTIVGEDGTEMAIEIKHFSHKHDLMLTDEIPNNTKCNGWSFNIGGICSIRWSLMKTREVDIVVGGASNQYLVLATVVKNAEGKEYGRFSKCDVCGEKSLEYSYCCYRCNFNIHIRCSSLSLTIQTEVHDPQLTHSIWKLMKFTCDFYGKEGNLPYFCVQSDFAIHSRCAACPRKLKVDCHNHPLHLTPYLEVHQSDSPICLLYVRKVDTLCLYYCSRCDFATHLYCALLPQNKEYINMQELKEEQSTESKSEDPELHQSFDSKICKVIKTTVGEDGTEMAIEIKHFSHKHDLMLTDEIPNNTKCKGCV